MFMKQHNSLYYFGLILYIDNFLIQVLGTIEDEVADTSYEPVKTPDVLLTVQIFIPERKQDQNANISRAKIPSFQVNYS